MSNRVFSQIIVNKLQTVGFLFFNFAIVGSSSSATRVIRCIKFNPKYTKIKEIYNKNIKDYKKSKDLWKTPQKAMENLTENDLHTEEVIKASAELASLINPSGSDFVTSLAYPKCSAVKPKTIS